MRGSMQAKSSPTSEHEGPVPVPADAGNLDEQDGTQRRFEWLHERVPVLVGREQDGAFLYLYRCNCF